MQLYIQHQICYRAKNPSLMNHHFCLLIPSDWLKCDRDVNISTSHLCSVCVCLVTSWWLIGICGYGSVYARLNEWWIYIALCVLLYTQSALQLCWGVSPQPPPSLGLFVNQLAFTIHVWNCQTDPKPAQILSTRPSQYFPAQSNTKPPNLATLFARPTFYDLINS